MKIFQKLQLVRKEVIKILKLESFDHQLIFNLKKTIFKVSEILKSQISRHFLLQFSTLSLAIISRILYIITFFIENKEKFDEYLKFRSKTIFKNNKAYLLNDRIILEGEEIRNFVKINATNQKDLEKQKEEPVILVNEKKKDEQKNNNKNYKNFIDELFEIKRANKCFEAKKNEKEIIETTQPQIPIANNANNLGDNENNVICLSNENLTKIEMNEEIQNPLDQKMEEVEKPTKEEICIRTEFSVEQGLQNQINENIIETPTKLNHFLNMANNNTLEEKAQVMESSLENYEITKEEEGKDNFIDRESDIKTTHLYLLKKIKKSKFSKISKLRYLKKLDLKMP